MQLLTKMNPTIEWQHLLTKFIAIHWRAKAKHHATGHSDVNLLGFVPDLSMRDVE
jgi:hypothetical protein